MQAFQYVGFWSRFWATIVDILILMVIMYPLFYLMYGDEFIYKAGDFTFINTLINYVLPFLAVIVLWKSKGATPGKMLIKAKIVDEITFEQPSTKQLIVRYFAYIISFIPLGLGYFWAGWDSRKQTWHDKLAHTVVVQPKKSSQKKSIGSIFAIVFGVFAIVIFSGLMGIGLMLQNGMMPDGDLYSAEKLPQNVTVELLGKNVLFNEEVIHYYQPESIFSFTKTATLFTDETIRYFETDSEGEVILWDFPLKKIGKLTLEIAPFMVGIEIVTMTIHNEEGEIEFSAALSPKSGKSKVFKKELMELWKNARTN